MVAAFGAPAHAALLYNADLGTRLDQQGWLYLTDPLFGATAQRSSGAGATRLDTTDEMSESAGFFSSFHPSMPVLDRQAGYTMQFEVGVLTESHSSDDRAGFSVLVIGDDLRAIELGFWTDEIWAQSGPNPLDPAATLFLHAESSGCFIRRGW